MATATRLGDMTVEEAAQEAAGNWRTFECFVWWREDELDSPDEWMIHYTHHRDSGLLDQSNAKQIRQALEPFTEGDDPDVVMESHSHWAVGHIDGFSLRVFKGGEITEAFRTFHNLMEAMAAYPILDESHYSELEHEATYENIDHAAWKIKQDYKLPEDWQWQVFDWLSENRDSALENVDDQGGWPDDDDLQAAFDALGFERIEDA
ncbi:hypothetical protein [Rubinisphaera brasiliensis]|uniref:Uncharacterized protein n=1 Tax=Rubinisphaera brasiliensis (strain ATCC 49424 / DSM 5305 / JCM 21570 / IAM 15109 / NBRC 103401 / IFAM 1448) TaxID=756272 RepID=F0SJ38_RUBBR|nr:hypothetical protein [Rubinisphaera brasiliensis]ADY58580.1 hypothetical protein Plabr_0959 [Rubinisphaera brasiliensis DSM 5305]